MQPIGTNCFSCSEEWESSSKLAAKSAFEWEAHSLTVSSHFESLLADWQAANTVLAEENHALKVELEGLRAVAGDTADSSLVASRYEHKLRQSKAIIRLLTQSSEKRSSILSQKVAFIAWRLRLSTSALRDLKMRKGGASPARSRAPSEPKPHVPALPIGSSSHNAVFKEVRQLYRAAAAPEVKQRSRTGFLLTVSLVPILNISVCLPNFLSTQLAFLQTGFWVLLLFLGHLTLSSQATLRVLAALAGPHTGEGGSLQLTDSIDGVSPYSSSTSVDNEL